jgi:tRNA(Ile)-lysidine synthase
MNKFCRNFITHWRKNSLPFANEIFIIAVSGGADSVSLALVLHQLKQLKKLDLQFVIAHFNHNLRGKESENDEVFVKNIAENLEFEFVCAKGEISKKGNLEQNARLARYEFLAQTAEKYSAYGILTAHTLNDQAETFLLNLIRGSGTDGLSAMSVNLRFNVQDSRFRIIRPLLSWAKRDDTEEFCNLQNIEFRQDTMNFDEKFARVRVRKHLIPLLQTFNPKIIETLSNTAFLINIKSKTQILKSSKDILIVKELNKLDKPILFNTLRNWLKLHRGNLRKISTKHIELIESLIKSRKSGRIIELPDGEKIVKSNGKLTFEKTRVEKTCADN